MIRAAVIRASGVAQLVAAGLLALVGARFGTAGVLFAVRERAPTLDEGAPPARPPPPPAASASAAPPPRPAGSVVKAGTTLRLPLVVTLGADRSELRVNGTKVGNTPYVGEISCRAGESIKLDILPPRGNPTTIEKSCVPGTLRVGE
ncbi:MAG: hypothetical protein IPM35_03910 [Myxococcales bacterium]|nr:hypothetical protein [Myxococcales bacterium]